MIANILDYLIKDVEEYPNKIAVEDEKYGTFTYSDLNVYAKKLASIIIHNTAQEKRPVVVYVDRSVFSIISFLGVVYSGSAYVPLDASMPKERMKKILKELDPSIIVTEEIWYEEACAVNVGDVICVSAQIIYEKIDEAAIADCIDNLIDVDPLYIIYTSGSTGSPKGVVISHKSVIDFVEEASEILEFTHKESFFNQAPFYFDASVPDIYCTLRNAATLHILTNKTISNPSKTLRYMEQKQINAIFWVPSNLIQIANSRCLEKANLECLKKIMFCGEVMPVKQLNVWKKYVPNAKYVNYYGPTETTYACTYYIVDRLFYETELLPIGKPCRNTSVLVLSENGDKVKEGEVGELCVKGTCLAVGYFANETITNEKFVQNPFSSNYKDIIYRTGDLVKYNDFGELEYVSRKDFQIKYHGYRIELGEIEAAISSVEGIDRNCCIFDEKMDGIYAFYESTQEIDLGVELENKLQSYMIPKKCFRLACIPLNNNGKVDRNALRNILRESFIKYSR